MINLFQPMKLPVGIELLVISCYTGQCSSEMRLDRLQDMEQQGDYMCMVSVPELNVSRHSNIACLTIKMDPHKRPEFNRKAFLTCCKSNKSIFFFSCTPNSSSNYKSPSKQNLNIIVSVFFFKNILCVRRQKRCYLKS